MSPFIGASCGSLVFITPPNQKLTADVKTSTTPAAINQGCRINGSAAAEERSSAASILDHRSRSGSTERGSALARWRMLSSFVLMSILPVSAVDVAVPGGSALCWCLRRCRASMPFPCAGNHISRTGRIPVSPAPVKRRSPARDPSASRDWKTPRRALDPYPPVLTQHLVDRDAMQPTGDGAVTAKPLEFAPGLNEGGLGAFLGDARIVRHAQASRRPGRSSRGTAPRRRPDRPCARDTRASSSTGLSTSYRFITSSICLGWGGRLKGLIASQPNYLQR